MINNKNWKERIKNPQFDGYVLICPNCNTCRAMDIFAYEVFEGDMNKTVEEFGHYMCHDCKNALWVAREVLKAKIAGHVYS